MMTTDLKPGDTIYHERRYWKSEGFLSHERPGWNEEYLPYRIDRMTTSTILVSRDGVRVQLPRKKRPKRPGYAAHQTLEEDGRQYHSRFCEYFYVEIPTRKPSVTSTYSRALSLLGVSHPFNADDVKRAYKRLARTTHPDAGGNHDQFIRLKEARDVALRGY